MTTNSILTNGILYLTLTGSLIESPGTQQLLHVVDECLGDEVINCAVDLSNVRYINSTGIGILVSLLTKFRSRGGEMVLINPAEHSTKTLSFSKINNIFAVAADKTTARQQLAAAAS